MLDDIVDEFPRRAERLHLDILVPPLVLSAFMEGECQSMLFGDPVAHGPECSGEAKLVKHVGAQIVGESAHLCNSSVEQVGRYIQVLSGIVIRFRSSMLQPQSCHCQLLPDCVMELHGEIVPLVLFGQGQL